MGDRLTINTVNLLKLQFKILKRCLRAALSYIQRNYNAFEIFFITCWLYEYFCVSRHQTLLIACFSLKMQSISIKQIIAKIICTFMSSNLYFLITSSHRKLFFLSSFQ